MNWIQPQGPQTQWSQSALIFLSIKMKDKNVKICQKKINLLNFNTTY